MVPACLLWFVVFPSAVSRVIVPCTNRVLRTSGVAGSFGPAPRALALAPAVSSGGSLGDLPEPQRGRRVRVVPRETRMGANVRDSGRGTLHAGHVREVPQPKILSEVFERDLISGFAIPPAAPREVGWHDFSDEAIFVVYLEGFAPGNPADDDVVVAVVAVAVAVAASVSSLFVVFAKVVDATATVVVFPLLARCGSRGLQIVSFPSLLRRMPLDDYADSHGKRQVRNAR